MVDGMKEKVGEDKTERDPADRGRELLEKQAKEAADPHVRGFSLFMLGELKDKELIDLFEQRLRDQDKRVRAQAAAALASVGKPALPRLISLLHDQDWIVRYRAAEALGIMKDPESLPFLIEALSDEKDHVRYMAAKAISETNPIEARDPLVAALSDENEFVRAMCAKALGLVGDSGAVEALGMALKNETDPRVREIISGVLDEMNKK